MVLQWKERIVNKISVVSDLCYNDKKKKKLRVSSKITSRVRLH